MNEIKVIKVQNLNDIELGQINSCANTLFITSTRSLNYQSNKSKKMNVVDFTQLHSQIKSLTKTKNCLSESEMRYLLHKTILDLENKTTKQAYKNSISQIYELFNNLLLSNVTEDCINLKQIKKTHLSSFSDVFQLYIDYLNTLKKQNKQTLQRSLYEQLRLFCNLALICIKSQPQRAISRLQSRISYLNRVGFVYKNILRAMQKPRDLHMVFL